MVLSIGYCIALLTLCRIGVTSATLNYTFHPSNFLLVIQGSVANLQLNITGVNKPLTIDVSTDDLETFTLEEESFQIYPVYETFTFPNGTIGQVTRIDTVREVTIPIRGIFLGIGSITFITRDNVGRMDTNQQIESYIVKVRRPPSAIQSIFTYVLTIWLVMSYITMGVRLDWKVIWGKLKRPYGVVIGALSQFIIMPGLAALMAKALNLDATSAVGLIIVGSCPGGWLSNIFTLLLDCDLILSLTMTFCSTVLALGLMPLNLFIYATPYANDDSNVQVPFLQIFISLITLVVPLLIGTYVAHRYPKAAKWFSRLLKPLALFLVIVGFAAGLWTNYFAFQSPPEVYLGSIILPFVGGLLGLFVSKFACLSNRSAVTVGIETGAQNAILATSLIALSFPQPEADLMSRVSVLLVTFTFIQGFCISSIVVLMKRCPGRFEMAEEEEEIVYPTDDSAKAPDKKLPDAVGNTPAKTSKFNKFVTKLQEKPNPRKSFPRAGMFSKGTQVDFDEITRSSTKGSTKGSRVNLGFTYDSERSGASTPRSGFHLSTISIQDVDLRNPSARQVYF